MRIKTRLSTADGSVINESPLCTNVLLLLHISQRSPSDCDNEEGDLVTSNGCVEFRGPEFDGRSIDEVFYRI